MIAYLIAGAVALAALGGLYWKVDHNGYERGSAEIKGQWDAANVAAQQKADADRARQEALRQAQDEEASRRLANEKKRATALWISLEAHIKAAGSAAQCPMPDGLRDAWNRANAGPEGERPRAVPAAGRAAPTAR